MKTAVKIIGAAVALLAGVGGAAGWYMSRGDPSAAYRTAQVRKTDVVSVISATGTVVPEEVVDVGAQVNGPIAAFGNDKDGKPIDYRSTIDQGMLLARIDDSIYSADVATAQAQLAQSQAQITSAEANRDQAKARLDQTHRDWDRAQQLAESPALARADYDAARSAYEQAIAALAVAEASIGEGHASKAIAEASLRRAQRNLAYCTITSPVEGVIIDKKVEIGQTVVASLNAPSLFLIAKDLKKMQVLVQVNEADIGSVQPGRKVTFTVDAHPGRNFEGQVLKIRLNATMTQNVVTYTVEIGTDNSDLRLLPYLTANVTFEVARRTDVLAVPNAALRWSPRDAAQAGDAGGSGSRQGGQKQGGDRSSGGPGGGGGGGGGGEKSGGEKGGGRGRGDRAGGATGERGAEPAQFRSGTVWVLDNGKPRAVPVRAGLSDGTYTEIEADGLPEGTVVIVAEQSENSNTARTPAGASPFAPQPFRGGGRR